MPAYRPQAGDEGADMAISAKELPLGKVFTPDFRFTIPFQRAYIWKTENILQLVSDLDDACKSPGTPYFLGSLILVREGDNRYDVIDGQQRLVSLSIIIAVLRDLERDPDLMRQLAALLVERQAARHRHRASPHVARARRSVLPRTRAGRQSRIRVRYERR